MVLLSCLLVALPVVVALAAGSHHRRSGHHHSVGPFIALGAAILLTLGSSVVLLWYLFNRPAYQRLMQYSMRRRNRVAKALRRGKPISPEDLDVADAVVDSMRKQRVFLWFQPVLIASWILMAIARHGVGRWLYAGLAVVSIPALAYGVRMRQRVMRTWETASTRSSGKSPDTG
jgi:hypothetical protein